MSRRGRRKGKLSEIGGALARVLSELGLDDAQRAFEIGEHWEEAVGREVARHSRPLALRGQVLEVAVDSSDLPPSSERRVFPARILFRAAGRSRLDVREIEIVVPGEDGFGCDEEL